MDCFILSAILKSFPLFSKKGENGMGELYSIMRDFLEVEYNQKALLYVLRTIEAAYSGEKQEESKLIANSAQYYVTALQEELRAAINRLDSYISEEAKEH